MIALDGVDFHYPASPAIFTSFKWEVQAGEAWAVLGPSGCGKTTLLYLLACLLRPMRGEIRIHGQPLTRPRPQTGLILQDHGLLPWATVEENAALGLRVRAFYGPDGTHAPADEQPGSIQERVDPWLDRLGLAAHRRNFPHQLSGGQRQRVAIARTLALHPDLLLMDEPFAALDAPTRESLQDLVLELREERRLTTIIVTHTIEEAAVLGHKILLFNEPPIERALVVNNPGGAAPGFRNTQAYVEICRELRSALEASA